MALWAKAAKDGCGSGGHDVFSAQPPGTQWADGAAALPEAAADSTKKHVCSQGLPLALISVPLENGTRLQQLEAGTAQPAAHRLAGGQPASLLHSQTSPTQ